MHAGNIHCYIIGSCVLPALIFLPTVIFSMIYDGDDFLNMANCKLKDLFFVKFMEI